MFTPGALQPLLQNPTDLRNDPKRLLRAAGRLLSMGFTAMAVLNSAALAATNRVGLPPMPGARVTNAAVHAGLRDVKGLEVIPSGWAWIGRIALALVLAGLGWWAWQRWRRQSANGPTESAVPPATTARERLREALSLIDQPQPFCFSITEIIRVYLEAQFGLRATEQTTEEFLASLQQSVALDQAHKRVLEDFLTRCDLVKFGLGEPEHHELEELHQSALRLVEETEFARPPQLMGMPPALSSASSHGIAPPATGASLDEILTGDARYMPRESVTVGGARSGASPSDSKEAGA